MRALLLPLVATCFFSAGADGQIPLDDLPEFGNRFNLTVVCNVEPTDRDQLLISLFNANPSLQRLVDQCNSHFWTTKTSYVQSEAWQKLLAGRFPSVLLQAPARSDGTAATVFYAGGRTLEISERLPQQIQVAINQFVESNPNYESGQNWRPLRPICPDGTCPWIRPRPRPQPNPQPEPRPVQPDQPDQPDPYGNIFKPLEPLVPDLDIEIEVVPDEEPGIPEIDVDVEEPEELPFGGEVPQWLIVVLILAGVGLAWYISKE